MCAFWLAFVQTRKSSCRIRKICLRSNHRTPECSKKPNQVTPYLIWNWILSEICTKPIRKASRAVHWTQITRPVIIVNFQTMLNPACISLVGVCVAWAIPHVFSFMGPTMLLPPTNILKTGTFSAPSSNPVSGSAPAPTTASGTPSAASSEVFLEISEDDVMNNRFGLSNIKLQYSETHQTTKTSCKSTCTRDETCVVALYCVEEKEDAPLCLNPMLCQMTLNIKKGDSCHIYMKAESEEFLPSTSPASSCKYLTIRKYICIKREWVSYIFLPVLWIHESWRRRPNPGFRSWIFIKRFRLEMYRLWKIYDWNNTGLWKDPKGYPPYETTRGQ